MDLVTVLTTLCFTNLGNVMKNTQIRHQLIDPPISDRQTAFLKKIFGINIWWRNKGTLAFS